LGLTYDPYQLAREEGRLEFGLILTWRPAMRLFSVALSIGLALSLIPTAQAEPPAEAPPKEPTEIGDDWMKANVEHDDRVHYGMPFVSDTTRELHIGYQGSVARGGLGMGAGRAVRRNKQTRYVIYFRAPKRTRVVAARAGRVADAGNGNLIAVLHDDGSFARYWPIAEANVKKGEPVERGAVLGLSGAQRGGDTAQLAFGVFIVSKRGALESLRVRFDDGSAEGFEPVQGSYYSGAEEKRAEPSE
jgi:murein DD-endopeptidase MepM/ murein hydrolase activator NlpD